MYPITADKPYRVDFFGDEIESIKTLDPVSQRSGESVHSIALTASPHMDIEKAKNGILDYLETSVAWALVEPESLVENLDRYSPEGADRIEEDSGTVFALRDPIKAIHGLHFPISTWNRCGFRNLDDLRNRVSRLLPLISG